MLSKIEKIVGRRFNAGAAQVRMGKTSNLMGIDYSKEIWGGLIGLFESNLEKHPGRTKNETLFSGNGMTVILKKTAPRRRNGMKLSGSILIEVIS